MKRPPFLGPRCATCGEIRPEQFRSYEQYRCKSCRRAYNAKRKQELRPVKVSA